MPKFCELENDPAEQGRHSRFLPRTFCVHGTETYSPAEQLRHAAHLMSSLAEQAVEMYSPVGQAVRQG